jgi:replicative DNA helicase
VTTAPTPPIELEAERALLGAFLLDPSLLAPSLLAPYVETLPAEVFYKESSRVVWEALRTLHRAGAGIDAITVAAELRRIGRFEDAGGHSFLAVLQEEATVATQVESYVRLVQAAATKARTTRARRAADRRHAERPCRRDALRRRPQHVSVGDRGSHGPQVGRAARDRTGQVPRPRLSAARADRRGVVLH